VVHHPLTYRRDVLRRFRFAFGLRWLALHVVVLAAGVTMVLLGRWQWRVAHVHHGSIQNYAYAFQWWAFTVFALFMWLRLIRDAAAPDEVESGSPVEAPAPAEALDVPYRRYVMPSSTSAPPVAGDAEHAAYNAYLAGLAAREDDA
jgi:DNA-binding transcriptional regulator of glucitol operon